MKYWWFVHHQRCKARKTQFCALFDFMGVFDQALILSVGW
jgi:hypothetical protein